MPPGVPADRLSPLADDLLLHILSFLRFTEDRARTSLLSRRFRHLWAHHPVICLRSSLFLPGAPSTVRYSLAIDATLRSFSSPTLHSLRLHLSAGRQNSHSDALRIKFAAFHSVHRLSLSSDSRAPLPGSLFSCKFLTSLDVSGCTLKRVHSKFKGFPLLKRLNFDDSSISQNVLILFISKCPVLESLTLSGCNRLVNLKIAVPTLRRLDLFAGKKLELVNVKAPQLRWVRFHGNVGGFNLSCSPCLCDADIRSKTKEETEEGFWVRPMSELSCALERLRVNEWFFEDELPSSPSPRFKNLKELRCDVQWATPLMLDMLVSVLGHCPNLQKLHLDFCQGSRGKVFIYMKYICPNIEEEEDYKKDLLEKINYLANLLEECREKDKNDPPEPLEGSVDSLHCLKTVVMDAFVGITDEMRLVEYLLRNADALEKITIVDFLGRGKEYVHELHANIPTASPHVQIC